MECYVIDYILIVDADINNGFDSLIIVAIHLCSGLCRGPTELPHGIHPDDEITSSMQYDVMQSMEPPF